MNIEYSQNNWKLFMSKGDFESAWEINDYNLRYNTKFRRSNIPRHFQQIWNGTALENKVVLIRCYHGLGDTIQFIRYLPLVESIARHTIVWVQPELIDLLKTMNIKSTLLPLHDGSCEINFDVDIEIMELPYIFRTTIHSIPDRVPYFNLPIEKNVRTDKIKVGIVWKAGDWDNERSIPFSIISQLADLKKVELYILQRGNGLNEHLYNIGILSGSDDIYQAALIVKSMNLVISVDTMMPHLAGALGVPVWLLLNSNPDWRWMSERSDSPWYPTMTIFRQKEPGNWQSLIADVKNELLNFIKQ